MTPTPDRSSPYTKVFYDLQQAGSYQSAEIIIPRLLNLARIQSAVDVGCGLGTWLRVLMTHGVNDVLGIDGDYVDRDALKIPTDRFADADISRPIEFSRRFDLALSLEVAEHLPASCAEAFVGSLARLAPVILFSAAIPFQGGTNHLNEQWPEYWAGIFRKLGYGPLDCIRRYIWNDSRVEWWYSQNILVYANDEGLSKHPNLARCREQATDQQLSLVHPRKYLMVADPPTPGFRQSLRLTATAAKNAIVKRVRPIVGSPPPLTARNHS